MYTEKVYNLSSPPAPHFHPSEIPRVVSLVYILPYLSLSSCVDGCFYCVLSEVGLYFVILQFIFPTKWYFLGRYQSSSRLNDFRAIDLEVPQYIQPGLLWQILELLPFFLIKNLVPLNIFMYISFFTVAFTSIDYIFKNSIAGLKGIHTWYLDW